MGRGVIDPTKRVDMRVVHPPMQAKKNYSLSTGSKIAVGMAGGIMALFTSLGVYTVQKGSDALSYLETNRQGYIDVLKRDFLKTSQRDYAQLIQQSHLVPLPEIQKQIESGAKEITVVTDAAPVVPDYAEMDEKATAQAKDQYEQALYDAWRFSKNAPYILAFFFASSVGITFYTYKLAKRGERAAHEKAAAPVSSPA